MMKSFRYESNLKKFILLSIFIVSITAFYACSGNEPSQPANTPVPTETETPSEGSSDGNHDSAALDESEQQSILDSFNQAVFEHKGIEGMKTLADLMVDQIGALSPDYAEQMLSRFENAQIKALEQDTGYGSVSDALAKALFEKKIFTRAQLDQLLSAPDQIGDAPLAKEIQRYLDRFYTIETQEGMYYLVVDYNRYMAYLPKMNQWFSNYVKLMARELSARTFNDAAMVIPLEEMWERTTAVEALLNRGRSEGVSTRLETSYQRLQQYFVLLMNALVYGGNNTPVYAYDNSMMSDERKAFFESHAFGTESDLYEAFEVFKAVAREEGYKLTERVNAARDAIFDVVESEYIGK